LGRSPKLIFEGGVSRVLAFNEAPGAAAVPSGLPSELLLRRPDIVQAEQKPPAANQRIAVARAAMVPSVSPTGFYGRESAALGTLFAGGPAGMWQVAGGITQPIFAGGRLKARTEAAEARARQAVASYQKTVQTAFSEVRAALAAQARSRQ